jgi:pectin methylesterase-like acyl-CoA thioesterase
MIPGSPPRAMSYAISRALHRATMCAVMLTATSTAAASQRPQGTTADTRAVRDTARRDTARRDTVARVLYRGLPYGSQANFSPLSVLLNIE